MSILDTIDSMANAWPMVTRRARGTMVNGKYVKDPSTTTFQITAVEQPATDLQRVVGGEDMRSYIENQRMDDVRMFYTRTELHARRKNPPRDPDIVHLDGDDWTVFRCESWNFYGEKFWMVVITRETEGGA